MSNFETHKKYGITVSAISFFAVIGLLNFHLEKDINTTVSSAVALSASTFLFSVFPDIDSQHSKPRQFLGKLCIILSVIVGSLFSIGILPNSMIKNTLSETLPEAPMIIKIFISITVPLVLISYLLLQLFDNYTKHRGNFHNPLVYFAISLFIIIPSYVLGYNFIILSSLGAGVSIGFMTHYTLDIM